MKFFVTADIHSFFTPFKTALDEAGFDPTNENHWLICCGDCFDRGSESEELLHYLMSLERKILVKGNHDLLLEELCLREFPYGHDRSNGTIRTVTDLGGITNGFPFDECCRRTWNVTAAYRSSLVNYFETENYIFVHSWIPFAKGTLKKMSAQWPPAEFSEDWRNASDQDWEKAMWVNPFFMAQDGLNRTGKTIVFGHWHCSFGHLINSDGELSEFGDDACWDIYRNADWKVIGVDKCTAHTNKVNVLVVEDNFI